jgi:hypothetical protein
MQTSLSELQKALFARLTSNEALMQKITGVYDFIPEQLVDSATGELKYVAFPYVTIGDPTDTAFDTKNSKGENIVLPIHIWSIYRGKAETYQIINLILAAIYEKPLLLGGGFRLFRMEREQKRVFKDIDNRTYHGVQELRFYINN